MHHRGQTDRRLRQIVDGRDWLQGVQHRLFLVQAWPGMRFLSKLKAAIHPKQLLFPCFRVCFSRARGILSLSSRSSICANESRATLASIRRPRPFPSQQRQIVRRQVEGSRASRESRYEDDRTRCGSCVVRPHLAREKAVAREVLFTRVILSGAPRRTTGKLAPAPHTRACSHSAHRRRVDVLHLRPPAARALSCLALSPSLVTHSRAHSVPPRLSHLRRHCLTPAARQTS